MKDPAILLHAAKLIFSGEKWFCCTALAEALKIARVDKKILWAPSMRIERRLKCRVFKLFGNHAENLGPHVLWPYRPGSKDIDEPRIMALLLMREMALGNEAKLARKSRAQIIGTN